METIAPYLQYIRASEEPLSADVYVIRGERATYVYDVGACEEALRMLSEIPGDLVVILSHFHPDHIGNIDRLSCRELYVGKKTFEKIHRGIVVTDRVTIEDGVRLEILRCPSPHAKGSLIVTVNREYTLLADLFYTRKENQESTALTMLHVLRSLDTKYFVVSHQEQNIFPKEELIRELTAYFKHTSS